MRWPVLYLAVVGVLLLQGDRPALARQLSVPVLGGVWTGETVNDSTTVARLEKAVTAHRAALQEYTRERVPLDWAMTQTNLGNALQHICSRENETARLEEAVAAYRAALQEQTRERVPLDWAMTQINLGNALWRLGERESGTARLEEAVTRFRAALEEHTRERVPLEWAKSIRNHGKALVYLAERRGDLAIAKQGLLELTAAFEALRAAGAPDNAGEEVLLKKAYALVESLQRG